MGVSWQARTQAEGGVDVEAADACVGVPGGHSHLAPGRFEPAVEEADEGQALDVDRAVLLELGDAGF